MKTSIKRAFLNAEDGQVLYRIGGNGEPLLLAVQLAKLAGNHIIGVCGSEAKSELVKALVCESLDTLDHIMG